MQKIVDEYREKEIHISDEEAEQILWLCNRKMDISKIENREEYLPFHSKNGHNFLGDYNYYVMPEEVYEQVKKEIPYQVGVYVPDGMNYRGEWYGLKAIKKAKRKDRSRPVSEMLLMMFRSAARDRR